MVKKPPLDPKWYNFVKPFGPEMWIAVAVTFLVCYISIFIYVNVHPEFHEITALDIIQYLYALIIGQGAGIAEDKPYGSSHGFRLYKGLLILTFFIITASFKGVLLAFLTVTIYPKPMDTLQEVAASGVTVSCASCYAQWKIESELGTNPHIKEIFKNLNSWFGYDFEESFRNISKGEVAMMEGKQFLDANMRTRFTDKYGISSMHIVSECPNKYNIAFSLPKHSIFREAFSKVVRVVVEAGLTKKYFSDEENKMGRLNKSLNVSAGISVMGLETLLAVFVLLLICLGVCLLVFLVEVWIGWKRKASHHKIAP